MYSVDICLVPRVWGVWRKRAPPAGRASPQQTAWPHAPPESVRDLLGLRSRLVPELLLQSEHSSEASAVVSAGSAPPPPPPPPPQVSVDQHHQHPDCYQGAGSLKLKTAASSEPHHCCVFYYYDVNHKPAVHCHVNILSFISETVFEANVNSFRTEDSLQDC